MGKKAKVGKQRKDKYYQLAKETGYRSRAAFKLIQLNRKFGFLQKSRVCIDLCAAPGGWMQVAHQNMPLSSVVVGVDLFPIKSIPGCIAITEDITSDKCKTALTKELKTWKSDVVLNDGAPNVGKNWLHDAYQQACLTLSALKLATQFLKQGGWFVTKVFRSKDYHPLIWVFKQLFKKVYATKPQASRNESAEIFVVCQHYIAPDKIDPKFLDAKYVFEDFDVSKRNLMNVLHPEKQKKPRAEGYPENDYTLHHKVLVCDFLAQENVIDAIRDCSEIVIDDEFIKNHPKTTLEIKECCKDIKVLGKKDLRALMAWWKQMRELKLAQGAETKLEDAVKVDENEDADSVIEEDELTAVDEQISKLEDEEKADSKRKRKRLNKERQKLAQKMNLKMVIKGDEGPQLEGEDMFNLKQVKSMKDLNNTVDQNPDVLVQSENESDDELKFKQKYLKYNNESTRLDKTGKFYTDSESASEISELESELSEEGLGLSESEEDVPQAKKKRKNSSTEVDIKMHPLLSSLEVDSKSRRTRKAELWFEKDAFKNIKDDEDEDHDLDKLTEKNNIEGKNLINGSKNKKKSTLTRSVSKKNNGISSEESNDDQEGDDDADSSDSDYDIEQMALSQKGSQVSKLPSKKNAAGAKKENSFEIAPQNNELKRLKKQLKMDEETLTLGTMISTSKKFRRDLIDDGWNRYMFNDTNLPDWFKDDETKNMKRPTNVPEKFSDEYKKRLEDINVRPIKKVLEAKARKKKRMIKRLERAKKKVENVMENADMSDREKARQVQQLYKKAQTPRKKEVTYIVAKKHTTGKRIKRPSGVKGQYKVVDPRMKKDMRSKKAKEKISKGGNKFQKRNKKSGGNKA